MNEANWNKWAAISEVVGTFAVVVSLIFVGVSIRQNTEVVQANQQNLLYESTDAYYADWVNNPEMYELSLKAEDPDALTQAERSRLVDQELRGFNIWENAYFKHEKGLLSEEQYQAWHDANTYWLECCMHQWIWNQLREGKLFRADFVEMVDTILASR